MKHAFIAATASILIASAASAAPFPQPQASSTVATQLSYSSVKYTIAGHSHASFPLPVTNRPINMTVACTTLGDTGMGSVTIMRVSGASDFLQWNGSDYGSVVSGTPADTGASSVFGDHIMFADASGDVDVKSNSVSSVRIMNNNPEAMTVIVTMTY